MIFFRSRLTQMMNHELVQLADRADWGHIEFFQHRFPIQRSSMTHWIKRAGEEFFQMSRGFA